MVKRPSADGGKKIPLLVRERRLKRVSKKRHDFFAEMLEGNFQDQSRQDV